MSNDPVYTGGSSRLRNLTVVGISGLAGCSTIILVIAALLLGLWLDSLVDVRGPFMILLVVLSIPLSLFVMLRIVLSATRLILSPEQADSLSETTLPGADASDGSLNHSMTAIKED